MQFATILHFICEFLREQLEETNARCAARIINCDSFLRLLLFLDPIDRWKVNLHLGQPLHLIISFRKLKLIDTKASSRKTCNPIRVIKPYLCKTLFSEPTHLLTNYTYKVCAQWNVRAEMSWKDQKNKGRNSYRLNRHQYWTNNEMKLIKSAMGSCANKRHISPTNYSLMCMHSYSIINLSFFLWPSRWRYTYFSEKAIQLFSSDQY